MSRPGVLRTRTESRLRLAAERALKACGPIMSEIGRERARTCLKVGIPGAFMPVTINAESEQFSEARGALHDLAAALEGK